MSEEQPQFPSPSRLVHEPARLAILTVLSSCTSADFVFLQRVTGLSKGNLSVQLSNLAQGGLVLITRQIIDKKTRTTVWLSELGTAEMKKYWQIMDKIRAHARKEKPKRSLAGRVGRLVGGHRQVQHA